MKFSAYNKVVEISDNGGFVVVNPKEAAWVELTEDPDKTKFKNMLETKDFDLNDELVQAFYEHGYIVDDSKNEFLDVKKFVDDQFNDNATIFTALLYVTKQCNFRCVYCPEDHVSENFSDELWDSLYIHIQDGLESGKYNGVSISFFGGEPLLEFKKIIQFMERMECLKNKYSDLPFVYRMTSNAYLLTPNVYDRLSELGLESVQVTVDAFAETHDKMRPRVDGGATWETIIQNLDYINSIDKGAKIIFRTNMNHINKDTMLEFDTWARKRYTNPKFIFTFDLVVEFSNNVAKEMLADENDKEIQKVIAKLSANNDKEDFYGIGNLIERFSMICNSAIPGFYAITPDWRVSKCENIYKGEDVYVGKLQKDGTIEFLDCFDKWKYAEIKECESCYIYPLCAARACPYKFANFSEEREKYCDVLVSHFEQNLINLLENQFGKTCTLYNDLL